MAERRFKYREQRPPIGCMRFSSLEGVSLGTPGAKVQAEMPHSGTGIVPPSFSSYVHVQPMLSFYFPVRPFTFRAAVVPWTLIVERVTETASKMPLRLHDVKRLQTWPASWIIPA